MLLGGLIKLNKGQSKLFFFCLTDYLIAGLVWLFVLRLQHTIVAERCPPFFLPANHRIPIALAGRRDADDDFVEPGKAVTPEAVTPPTPPGFKPWKYTDRINSILMSYQRV